MKNKIIIFLAGTLIAISSWLVGHITKKEVTQPLRGVNVANEYHATTTSTGRFQKDAVLLTYPGTLGSVVITGAAAGIIELYDATTSNISQRAATMSTSSVLIASFPLSAAAGTYAFDQIVVNGLYVLATGTMPTSTITYR